jgi:hypothetical protein
MLNNIVIAATLPYIKGRGLSGWNEIKALS